MAPLLLIAAATPDTATLIAAYRARTRSEVRCDASASSSEILVCGKRDADRYRVPFLSHAAGDPAHEGVTGERQRLLYRPSPCQEHGPFLVGCGMAGVGLHAGGGGKAHVGGLRPPAP